MKPSLVGTIVVSEPRMFSKQAGLQESRATMIKDVSTTEPPAILSLANNETQFL